MTADCSNSLKKGTDTRCKTMDFMHCNICFDRQIQDHESDSHPEKKFYLSSCGHLFCMKCVPAHQVSQVSDESTKCPKCVQVCTVKVITSQLDNQLAKYFQDPSQMCAEIQGQCGKLMQILNFQSKHTNNFMANIEKHAYKQRSQDYCQLEKKLKVTEEECMYWKRLCQSSILSSKERRTRLSDPLNSRTPKRTSSLSRLDIAQTPDSMRLIHQKLLSNASRNAVRTPNTPGPVDPRIMSPLQSPCPKRHRISQINSMEKLLNQKERELSATKNEKQVVLNENKRLQERLDEKCKEMEHSLLQNKQLQEEQNKLQFSLQEEKQLYLQEAENKQQIFMKRIQEKDDTIQKMRVQIQNQETDLAKQRIGSPPKDASNPTKVKAENKEQQPESMSDTSSTSDLMELVESNTTGLPGDEPNSNDVQGPINPVCLQLSRTPAPKNIHTKLNIRRTPAANKVRNWLLIPTPKRTVCPAPTTRDQFSKCIKPEEQSSSSIIEDIDIFSFPKEQ